MAERRSSLRPSSRAARQRRLLFERLEDRALLSLTHLYTFNDGSANDWVGAADGTLHNGASIVNGQLALQNAGVFSGETTAVQHAQLPSNVLPAGAATIEVWFITSNAANWTRVFDIGNQSGTAGDSYIFFTPRSGSGDSRVVLHPSGSTDRLVTAAATDNGAQHMAAIVIDTSAGLLRLYIDGAASGTAALSGANAGSVNDTLAYLGRSLFNQDQGFTGLINEVRIYDEAVSASLIQAHASAGPAKSSLLTGDYNSNAAVDAADYVLSRNNLEGYGGNPGYTTWRANFGRAPSALSVNNASQTYATLTNATVTMTGRSELHITGASNPLHESLIHLNSQDAWLFLENIKPSAVSSTYLSQIRVNGAAPVHGTNVRIVQYGTGTVIIPHGPSFQPFQAFAGPNFTGASQSFSQYTYYDTAAELGTLNRNFSSFKLKSVYMSKMSM
jgi:hypothetical protein